MPSATPDDLAARIARLPASQQGQAMAFVSRLERVTEPAGLLAFVGAIAPDDLATMTAAIEAGCERVDATQW